MRATLFVSSLFAVSLIGSAALAERPSEGVESRRTVRDHKVHEVRPREASTVRERAPQVQREKAPAREVREIKEHPTRADNIDRSYAAHAAVRGEVHQSLKPDTPKINKVYQAARNCSELTSDCSVSRIKSAGDRGEASAAKKEDKREMTARDRAKAQEMVKVIHKILCERHAAACADYL